MAEPFEYYQNLASQLIDKHRDRDNLFEGMDKMYHGEYNLPGELEQVEWMYKMTSTDPHDSVETGARVLSTVMPKITYHPRLPTGENKKRANEIETMLQWWLKGATKRRKTRIINDIMKSALLYDTVAVQVIHMKNQQKAMGDMGGFMEYDNRYGPFALDVHHPGNVYVMENVWGLRGVLLVKTEELYETLDFWGKKADGLRRLVDEGKADPRNPVEFTHVTIFDYMDRKTRVVWGVLGTTDLRGSPVSGKSAMIIEPTEHGLPFIPWVYRSGASNLAATSDKQLHPMLYSIYRTGQWEAKSLLDSIQMGQVVAFAGAPRRQVSGPNPDSVEIDYDEPGGVEYVPPGHSSQPLQPPALDEKLTILSQQISANMDTATAARILQGASSGSEAFATLNLRSQSAVGVLSPHKLLAEMGIADICELELLWVKHMGDSEVAYSQERGKAGKQYSIEPDEIDPGSLYIDVELKPDVPTDRIARINGARLLVGMGYPNSRALEETGVADPEQAINEGYQEMIERAMVEQKLRAMMEEENLKLQIRMQQLMQQFAPPPEQQPGMQPPIGGVPGGAGFPEGGPNFAPLPPAGPAQDAFNPAMGGTPPAELAPDMTRETLNGTDRSGREF